MVVWCGVKGEGECPYTTMTLLEKGAVLLGHCQRITIAQWKCTHS